MKSAEFGCYREVNRLVNEEEKKKNEMSRPLTWSLREAIRHENQVFFTLILLSQILKINCEKPSKNK